MPGVEQGDYPGKDKTGNLPLEQGWYFFLLGQPWHLMSSKEIKLAATVRLEGNVPAAAQWWVGWVVNLLSLEVRVSWNVGEPLVWRVDGGAPFLDQEISQKGKGPWYDDNAVALLRGESREATTVFVSDTPQIRFAHYRQNDPAQGELKELKTIWKFAAWLLGRSSDASQERAESYQSLYAVSYSAFRRLDVVQGVKGKGEGVLFSSPEVRIQPSILEWDTTKGIPKNPVLFGKTANEVANATFPKALRPVDWRGAQPRAGGER